MLFYVLLTIHFLFCMVTTATRPVISLFADSQGVSLVVIGILASVYALFPMFMSIKFGKLLDFYGAKKMTILGLTGIIIALTVPTLNQWLGFLFFSQIFMGLGHVCVLLAVVKSIGNLPGNRDKLIATYSLVGSVGELVGPLSGGFIYEYFGFRVSFGIFATLTSIALIIALLRRSDLWASRDYIAKKENANKTPTFKLLCNTNLRKALIASGLVVYAKDLYSAYFPIYGEKIGMTASTIGLNLSLMSGAAIIIRLLNLT